MRNRLIILSLHKYNIIYLQHITAFFKNAIYYMFYSYINQFNYVYKIINCSIFIELHSRKKFRFIPNYVYFMHFLDKMKIEQYFVVS